MSSYRNRKKEIEKMEEEIAKLNQKLSDAKDTLAEISKMKGPEVIKAPGLALERLVELIK